MIYNLTLPEDMSDFPTMEEVAKALHNVYQQREQILIAFLAQYGLLPNQVEQVEQHTVDGIVWFVRKRKAE